jgi:phenylpyruvate tautomerase PptA (4-oxalocrotonate tautomerase family)
MPILEVEIVGECGEVAKAVADAVAREFADEEWKVWVRLRRLDPRDYAESEGGSYEPVFVSVLSLSFREGERMATTMRRIATAVAAAVGRPLENVHVTYEPAARGRLAFGGEMAE